MGRIITISRQFSSGGREVGRLLAELLGYSYYDKELIKAVSEKTGFVAEYIDKYSEVTTPSSFPYTIGRAFGTYKKSPLDDLQAAQSEVLKDIVEVKGSVVVGRSADYILRDKDPFKVFIYSSNMDARIDRCYDTVPEDKEKSRNAIESEINKIDKQREKYYRFCTGQKWGETENYNLCIDTYEVDVVTAANIIALAVGIGE